MVSSKVSSKQHSINHDAEEAQEKLSPTYNLTICTDYFKTFGNAYVLSLHLISPISNTPPLPTYAQVTSIIRTMKSKGSACPLACPQLSIILFKNPPIYDHV